MRLRQAIKVFNRSTDMDRPRGRRGLTLDRAIARLMRLLPRQKHFRVVVPGSTLSRSVERARNPR